MFIMYEKDIVKRNRHFTEKKKYSLFFFFLFDLHTLIHSSVTKITFSFKHLNNKDIGLHELYWF